MSELDALDRWAASPEGRKDIRDCLAKAERIIQETCEQGKLTPEILKMRIGAKRFREE